MAQITKLKFHIEESAQLLLHY